MTITYLDVRPNPIALCDALDDAKSVTLSLWGATDGVAVDPFVRRAREHVQIEWRPEPVPGQPAPNWTVLAPGPTVQTPMTATIPTEGVSVRIAIGAKPNPYRGTAAYELKVSIKDGRDTSCIVGLSIAFETPSSLKIRNRQMTLENIEGHSIAPSVAVKYGADNRWWNVSMSRWLDWSIEPSATGIKLTHGIAEIETAEDGDYTLSCSVRGASECTDTATLRVVPTRQHLPLWKRHGSPERASEHMLFVPEGFRDTKAERDAFVGLVDAVIANLRTGDRADTAPSGETCYWIAWWPSAQRGVATDEHKTWISTLSHVPDTAWGLGVSGTTGEVTFSPRRDGWNVRAKNRLSAKRWNEVIARHRESSQGQPSDLRHWEVGNALPPHPIVFVLNQRSSRAVHQSHRAHHLAGFIAVCSGAVAGAFLRMRPAGAQLLGDQTAPAGTAVDGNEGVTHPLLPQDVRGLRGATTARRLTAALVHELGHYRGLGDEYSGHGPGTAPPTPAASSPNLFVLPATQPNTLQKRQRIFSGKLPWAALPRVEWFARVVEVARASGSDRRCFFDVDPFHAFVEPVDSTSPSIARVRIDSTIRVERYARAAHGIDPDDPRVAWADLRSLSGSPPDIRIGDLLIGPPLDATHKVPDDAWSLVARATARAIDYGGVFVGRGTTPPRAFGQNHDAPVSMPGPTYRIVAAFEGGYGQYESGIVHPSGRCKMNREQRQEPTGPGRPPHVVPQPFCYVCRYILAARIDPSRLLRLESEYPDVR